jgi:hypothetical protein
MNRILFATAVSIALAGPLAASAMAQTYDVQIPHFVFLDRQPPDVPYDQPIVVRIKGFKPSEHPGLRARFFRGKKATLPQTPHGELPVRAGASGSDRCLIYKTWEPQHLVLREGAVDLGRLPLIPKLNEHWVVIFEEGEWRHGLIKVSQHAVKAYFDSGYEFVIRDSSAVGQAGNLWRDLWLGVLAVIAPVPHLMSDSEEAAATTQGLQEVEQALHNEQVCVHFVHYESPAKQVLVAVTTPCEPCSPPPAVTTAKDGAAAAAPGTSTEAWN